MSEGKSHNSEVKGFTIVYQIIATMLIIAVIPLGGLWYISIYKSKADWSNNIYQSLTGTSQTIAQRIDDWVSMNLRLIEQAAHLPTIKNMDSATQNPVLETITDSYEWIYLAFTIQPDGQNVGRSDGKPVKFYGDRSYFQQIMNGKDIGQQVLLGKTSGKPALILSGPIVNNSQDRDGVFAIAMTLEDLSATVTNAKIGNTGFAILVDEQNRLLAHGQGGISNSLQDMSDHPVLKQTGQLDNNSFVFQHEGKKIVGAKFPTKLGWQLIVTQDYDEAFASAELARVQALFLLGATLVIVILVAYLLARRLSMPILKLTAIAEQISKGDLKAEIKETSRNDEIGALARAIERMGMSLRMAFDRLRKKS